YCQRTAPTTWRRRCGAWGGGSLLPSNLRTDEPPPVLVGPPFGGAHPFRRTGLEQALNQHGIILGGSAVLPAQDGPHHGPGKLDCLQLDPKDVSVDGLVLLYR